MNCETVREYFSDLVEGKVEPALRGALENHIRSCGGCDEEFAAFRRAWDMLESIPWVETPAHLHGRIMSAVRQLKAEQEAERRPVWQSWWDRLTRPVNQKASLGWSMAAAAAIVLVGIAVQVGPNGISLWLPPAVKVSQVTPLDNLLAAQVLPDAVTSSDGLETVTVSVKSPRTDVRVRVYVLDAEGAAGSWQPWMLSSLTPANGLSLVADTQLTRSPVAYEVFSRKFARDRSRGVDVLLVRLTAGGASRSLAIFRPSSPGQEAKVTPARQMEALCSAVYEIARCHQNFVVCEAELDMMVRLESSDSTLYSLDDLARQTGLVMDVLPNGVYTLTRR
jgi:hypothetical protein